MIMFVKVILKWSVGFMLFFVIDCFDDCGVG